jgi:hypothetical protein
MTTTVPPSPTLTHIRITEPALVFDPSDASRHHFDPLAGLAEFGPYSASAWKAARQQVRVAILEPHDAIDPVRDLLNSLRNTADPQERADYMPPYPGFRTAFRTVLVPAADEARQPLPHDLDRQIVASTEPHLTLAGALTAGLS